MAGSAVSPRSTPIGEALRRIGPKKRHDRGATPRNAHHLRQWTQDGFRLAAISDLNEAELDEFVRLWRAG